MKWLYVIAMAALVVGSCTLRPAQASLLAEPGQLQHVKISG
jgi:hypothetical protein